MKCCTICNLEKEESLFTKNRNQCKECRKNRRIQRYKDNIEFYREKRKKNYEDNKESEKKKRREYYQNNKEKEKEYQRNRWKENSEPLKMAQKKWSSKNKEKKKERDKRFYNKNKEKLRKKQNEYAKKRKLNDDVFKLKIIIRNNIYQSLFRKSLTKNKKTEDIIGCSYDDFKLYIESKFEPWMNWDNYGLYDGELFTGWDLDHIVPISSATTEEEVISLNHYTNFQPLCSKINRDIKRNKIISDNLILDSNLNDIPEYLDAKCS